MSNAEHIGHGAERELRAFYERYPRSEFPGLEALSITIDGRKFFLAASEDRDGVVRLAHYIPGR